MEEKNNSLGCGKMFKTWNGQQKEVLNNPDFICGVADGWGAERLCKYCNNKLKKKWLEEDLNLKELEGGKK